MSPHGLGLPPTFWTLASVEFNALKRQWARVQAQALNLQANTEGVPFIPDDFLGIGDRELRVAEAKAQKEIDAMEVTVQNFKLLSFQGGLKKMDTSNVPKWMLEAKRGR